MYYYYGDKLPLKLLDEAAFWKLQEKEHTVVIRQIVPNLEKVYVDALKKWEEAFAETEGRIVALKEAIIRSGGRTNPQITMQTMELIKFCNEQSKQFILFLNDLVKTSNAVAGNIVAITVINHIRRESEYFVGITKAILSS